MGTIRRSKRRAVVTDLLAAARHGRRPESALLDRLADTPAARAAAVAVPGGLAALGGLHAAWALGWRWPGGDDRAFAERVVGGPEVPPVAATWAMAALLPAAGTVLTAAARDGSSRKLRVAAWTVAGTLLVRGVAFVPSDLLAGLKTPFARLDLTIYGPLCLGLGGGAALVLWRSGAQG